MGCFVAVVVDVVDGVFRAASVGFNAPLVVEATPTLGIMAFTGFLSTALDAMTANSPLYYQLKNSHNSHKNISMRKSTFFSYLLLWIIAVTHKSQRGTATILLSLMSTM